MKIKYLLSLILICSAVAVLADSPKVSDSCFPVLEYHVIGSPEARWTRTPEKFTEDLQWLYDNGYYPMNLRDLLNGFKDLPKGKKPVVLTFDDSSSSQFRYLPNGELDPKCAVGIIKKFHEKHPSEWPMRATFFIVVQTNNPDRNVFGQPERPEYKKKKLRQLAAWGMEVASHTYWHTRLNNVEEKMARYSLARSYYDLKMMSGQEIVSLALPMGLYPSNEAVFSGKYQRVNYDFKLVCEVAGGMQVFPSSPKYNPRHINRIQAIGEEWEKFFGRKDRSIEGHVQDLEHLLEFLVEEGRFGSHDNPFIFDLYGG